MEKEISANEESGEVESLSPKELMRKHLNDPNHQVTDEELRNVKVGVDAEDEQQVIEGSEKIKEKINTTPDNTSLPNPYSVIG